MRKERELTLDCGEECVACAREGDEERVALCIDLVTTVRLEGCPQQPLVVPQHLAVAFTQFLDEPGRPFDVAEEESDCAARLFRHKAKA